MVLCGFESLRRLSTSFKNVTPRRAFFGTENAKKARNSGLFSYLHHFWQVNLAGAEGLEPSARGFGVDVGEHGRERGKERCWPILPDKSQKSGAGLVLWGIFQAEIRCQIASLRGSSTTGQDLYSSQGSKSMQAAGSRFPSKSQAKVLLRTVRHSLNTCPTRGTQCRLCGTTQFLV